jgi:type III secretory pathway component EscT
VTCADNLCGSTDSNGLYQYYQIQAFSITLYETTTYSLSFWAKGSTNNIVVVLYNGVILENTIKYFFTISSQWRQFAVPKFNVPKTADYYLRLLVVTPNTTVWFDNFRVSPIEMSSSIE